MRNKIVLDIHTHTTASGHAYGTVAENAMAAREKGLTGLGISDHAPGIPGVCEPGELCRLRENGRSLYGINIYYGVENNVLNNGAMTLPGHYLSMLDYCIVGIQGTCYEDRGPEENTDNLIRCMQDPKTFFVSHPDDGAFPLDYEKLVLAAKENNVALELNNSHIRHPWRKDTLKNIRIYLDLCKKYKTNIFIGSDAHSPDQVGSFSEAIALLDEIGFDDDLIINNNEEKFRAFIGLGK